MSEDSDAIVIFFSIYGQFGAISKRIWDADCMKIVFSLIVVYFH